MIDWEAQRATCPQGRTSVHWWTRANRQGRPATQIRFAMVDCAVCPVRSRCTQSASKPRVIQVHDRDHDAAVQAARQRQQSELFQRQYARRAGIEGTIAQGTRIGDLRRSRYIGLAKTTLVHVLIAAALNFMRVAAWLVDTRRAKTRHTPFAKLGGVPI